MILKTMNLKNQYSILKKMMINQKEKYKIHNHNNLFFNSSLNYIENLYMF